MSSENKKGRNNTIYFDSRKDESEEEGYFLYLFIILYLIKKIFNLNF